MVTEQQWEQEGAAHLLTSLLTIEGQMWKIFQTFITDRGWVAADLQWGLT